MAQKKKKAKSIDGGQFLSNQPPQQWPDRVQVNPFSITGYSYGTLEYHQNENGVMDRDGFEIEDTDWVVTEAGGTVTRMKNEQMQIEYED